jgi:cold shock CspA family protein
MRLHGTLTKWNDDRGFGFVTPAKGTPDIFVHISAFPREGGRPRLNELISFETEAGPDGKQRAVRVMRPGRHAAGRSTATREQRRPQGRRLGGALALLAVAAIGAYGYSRFARQVAPEIGASPDARTQSASASASYSCDGRTMCSQMTSCAEAKYFIRNCPNTQMDGDGDGEPCESQWCN